MIDIRVGETLCFEEPEYCYGLGQLRLQVTKVISSKHDGVAVWIEIRGKEIWWDGAPGEERQVWVIESAIPKARLR